MVAVKLVKGKRHYRPRSKVLGKCPVERKVNSELQACGRSLLYSFEVNQAECIQCRNRRRWAEYFKNPAVFYGKSGRKPSRVRMRELDNKPIRIRRVRVPAVPARPMIGGARPV